MDYTAPLQEIEALLEVMNGKLDGVTNNVAFVASQQAATAQSTETFYYLAIGLLAGILASIGVIFGAKIIKALLEVASKWL